MEFLNAKMEDLYEIDSIILDAKNRLKEAGSTQWQSGKPNVETIASDIELRQGYVVKDKGVVVAYVSVWMHDDPNYNLIFDGSWEYSDPYVCLHRFVVDSSYYGKGIGRMLLQECIELARLNAYTTVRIDTHRDNIPMIRLIESVGFQYRGVVFVDDPLDAKRNAYEYVIK